MLFDPVRHEPLAGAPWHAAAARRGIQAIADASCADFADATFWPTDPRDLEPGDPPLPNASLYQGAAGVIWALQRLQHLGLADVPVDFGATIDGLHGRVRDFNRAADMPAAPSYFLGDAGVLLLQWKHRRETATAEALMAVAGGNLRNPTREALWGSPGTLVAAIHMLEALDDDPLQQARWQTLFRTGVDIVLAQMQVARHSSRPDQQVWLWTQDLYGRQPRYLGAGHGFAGNVYPVLRGARWLDDAVVRTFEERATRTLDVTAARDAGCINWDPWFDPRAAGHLPRPLVQDCHGAPGIICRLAATCSPALRDMLVEAGRLVWQAGPLTKGPGLCYGTAGNGYALLKLHTLTGDSRWLERARAFAMHALAQTEAAATRHGRHRHSLWTGDQGVAMFLAACLDGDDRLPTLDVF